MSYLLLYKKMPQVNIHTQDRKRPNEDVLKAIEKLDYKCSVAQVVSMTGLPTDEVECEMAIILRYSNGFFEVVNNNMKGSSERQEVRYVANVYDTTDVHYVYPHGLRSLLRRHLLSIRFQEAIQSIGKVLFSIVRVSFGILLLLSLAVIFFIIVIVAARNNDARRHVDALRLVPRSRRVYYHGRGFDASDCWWWMWWYNNNPFFVGVDFEAQQRARERQERRRMLAALGDEEEGGGQWSMSSSSRRRRGNSSHQEEVVEEYSFLESVFSLLFGDGKGGLTEAQRWQKIAQYIHKQQGVVLPEEVVPFLAELDENNLEKSMLAVVARFGGKPVFNQGLGTIYDFPRLRIPQHQTSFNVKSSMDDEEEEEEEDKFLAAREEEEEKDSYRALMEEKKYPFSRAPRQQLQLAAALGLINLVGAMYISEELPLMISGQYYLLLLLPRVLLLYAWMYLLLPLLRLLVITKLNHRIDHRNALRRALWEHYVKQAASSQSHIARTLWAQEYRKRQQQVMMVITPEEPDDDDSRILSV